MKYKIFSILLICQIMPLLMLCIQWILPYKEKITLLPLCNIVNNVYLSALGIGYIIDLFMLSIIGVLWLANFLWDKSKEV